MKGGIWVDKLNMLPGYDCRGMGGKHTAMLADNNGDFGNWFGGKGRIRIRNVYQCICYLAFRGNHQNIGRNLAMPTSDISVGWDWANVGSGAGIRHSTR